MPPYLFTIFDDLAELMLASSQFAKTFTEFLPEFRRNPRIAEIPSAEFSLNLFRN